jgi:hypothetical protein
MKVIIDRFEGIYAVCEKEDNTMIDIKRIDIPKDAREGDVLNIEDDSITIDEEETKRRKKKLKNLQKIYLNRYFSKEHLMHFLMYEMLFYC